MRSKHKRITCIVPEANATRGAAALRETYGLQTINHHFARGIGKSSPLIKRGIGEKTEKVVLSLIVESKIADEVFEFLFHATEIDRPRGGLIFMHAVHSLAFEPIEIPAEESEEESEEEPEEEES